MSVGNHTLPTNLQDSCDGVLYCVAQWAYDVTNGFFWAGVLLAFVVVVFIATQRFGTPRSFGFASFVGMMAATYLAILVLIPWWIASLFILVGLAGLATLILQER